MNERQRPKIGDIQERINADGSRMIVILRYKEAEFGIRRFPFERTVLTKLITATKDKQLQLVKPYQVVTDIEEGKKTATVAEMTAHFAVMTGAGLADSDANRKTRQKLHTIGAPQDVIDYFALLQFRSFTGAEMKIGDISLADIANQTKENRLPITSILHYSMESLLMNHRTTPQEYVVDNIDFPANEYPHYTAGKLYHVANNLVNVFNILNNPSFPQLVALNRIFPEYVKRAQDLIKQFNIFHSRLYEHIFEPDSSSGEFQSIKKKTEKYLDYDGGVRLLTIYFLSHGGRHLSEMYRRAKKLEDHPGFGDFYKKIADAAMGFAEFAQPIIDKRFFDDVETIFSPQQSEKIPSVNIDTLRKSVAGIFSQSSQREYDISLDDWGDIVEPQECKLSFDSKNNFVFKINLSYTSEEEDMDIEVYIDTKKGEFDWNFLESPEDERMQPFATALRGLTDLVLKNVYTQAKAIKDAKRNERNKTIHVPGAKVSYEKTKPEPEVIEPSTKRKRQSAQLVSLEELFADRTAVQSKAERHIILPQYIPIPKGVEERVRKKIDEFNRTGAGTLTQVPYDRHDRVLFKFRVGGIRVLLRKDGNTFTVVEIGDRRDIYKKLPGKNV